MKTIRVNVLGRPYSLKVQDDAEHTMHEIAEFANKRFADYRKELIGQPDTTIHAMAVLSLVEELFIERKKHSQEIKETLDPIHHRLDKLLADIHSENSDI